MSDSSHQPSDRPEATANQPSPERTEYIERSDVGVSLTVKLKRGTGTRDEDRIEAKVKAKTLADAREDMETLREYLHELAADARRIQPADSHEE